MEDFNFSFLEALSEDRKLKAFFDALPELDQLRLMQGCSSYGEFYDRGVQAIPKC